MRKFLTTCAAIEETIGATYRQLADSVSCDDGLKKIWKKMAAEEDQHAIELRFASRLPEEYTFKGGMLSREKAEQLLDKAKAFLEESRSGRMDEASALRISLQLEGEFMQIHVASAAEFIDKKMEAMFKRIASDEESHVRDLKNYYAKRFL